MLNGIPFGSASGVVSDSDSEVKAVGELRLEFGFPSPPVTAVAAAGIGQSAVGASRRIDGIPHIATSERWREPRRQRCRERHQR
jgi:hypothetical protein